MPLILTDTVPYHWALAGAGIAVLTLLLLWLTNKRLGISSCFENLCSLVVSAPYFRRPALKSTHSWKIPLVIGLILSGVVSASLAHGWTPLWDLGVFDQVISWGHAGKLGWMFVGGILIGFGTRLSGGCTSGHGIFGLSNLEISGLVSTLGYMAAGILTTNLIYRVIWELPQ